MFTLVRVAEVIGCNIVEEILPTLPVREALNTCNVSEQRAGTENYMFHHSGLKKLDRPSQISSPCTCPHLQHHDNLK